ncbi:MAG: hypothetical protein R2867_17390 [Caldilineaceae bacterium]
MPIYVCTPKGNFTSASSHYSHLYYTHATVAYPQRSSLCPTISRDQIFQNLWYSLFISNGRFVAGTRDAAMKLFAEYQWDEITYSEVGGCLRQYLPMLTEGKVGFSAEPN